MGLFLMGVKVEGLRIGGVSTLRAWERGVLPSIMAEGIPLKSAQQIAAASGVCAYKSIANNLVVDVFSFLVGDWILTASSDDGAKFQAIGTDGTTPVVGDTVLGTEVRRKAFATSSRLLTVVLFSTFFLASESTFNLTEAGLFAGVSATTTVDTGIMLSHYLQPFDNTLGDFDLTFDYELTIG